MIRGAVLESLSGSIGEAGIIILEMNRNDLEKKTEKLIDLNILLNPSMDNVGYNLKVDGEIVTITEKSTDYIGITNGKEKFYIYSGRKEKANSESAGNNFSEFAKVLGTLDYKSKNEQNDKN